MPSPIVELAAVTVDCRDPAPMIAFYAAAFGAAVSHENDSGAWIHVDGGPLILVRRVEDHTPPTWPGAGVPMQLHLELFVDDLADAEARLTALGATVPSFQPHRAEGNVVLLDPAGHPLCIASRVDLTIPE